MGLTGGQVAELVVFILCIVMFLLYHVWYFFLPTFSIFPGDVKHINLWITSVKTRSLWCEIMMQDPKEGINSVQTVRNMIISVSLLATADAALLSTLLNLFTDPQRLEQMRIYSKEDPISGGDPLMGPAVKSALAFAALFFSFLTFAQCVRIAVHLGFLIRVIPAHPHINLPLREETILLMQRASLYFTIGLRLLYGFVPLAFYMATGPLAMLIATTLLLIWLILLDTVPARQVTNLLRVSTAVSMEAAMYNAEAGLVHGSGAGTGMPTASLAGGGGGGGVTPRLPGTVTPRTDKSLDGPGNGNSLFRRQSGLTHQASSLGEGQQDQGRRSMDESPHARWHMFM